MDGLTNRHLADLPALVRQAADGDTTATASLKEPAFLTALDDFLAAITRGGSSNNLPYEFRSVVTTYLKTTTPRLEVTRNLVADWTERAETFFDLPDGDPPYQLYFGLTSLAHHGLQPVEATRRRVYLILFHDLREAFVSRFGNTQRDTLAIYLFQLYKALDRKVIKKNCTEWANGGAKYKKLAESSGGYGALLVPTSIGRSTLESRMVLSVDNEATRNITKKFADDVYDRAVQWNCDAAAKKLFAYYSDYCREWLENLCWQPSLESLGNMFSKAQGTARKRKLCRRRHEMVTLECSFLPAYDIGFAVTTDVRDHDPQGGTSGTSAEALGPGWPTPSICPGPSSTPTEMSEASCDNTPVWKNSLGDGHLLLPAPHHGRLVPGLSPEHICDCGPLNIEVWANSARYRST